MCGISGFVDYSKQLDADVIRTMLSEQHHRGPDSEGTKSFLKDRYSVSLHHNRLAIIDLTVGGHQPMSFGKYHIVFNGEIYNYKAIQSELSSKYTFTSGSDTEVILKAFKEWGKNCVTRFRGMFSIIIFDEENETLHIWRDRLGVKPLYYYWDENLFVFASELKTITSHPRVKPIEDQYAVYDFFQLGYVPDSNSIYSNIHKVQPSEYLNINLTTKRLHREKYWDLPTESLNISDEQEVLRQLESELEDSIRLRLVSDVPVGLFLSGGVDSSLLASMVQKKIGKDISTFTIEFADKEFNEGEAAKAISKHLGTKHHSYLCTEQDLLNFIENKYFTHFDEPFGDASALPTYMVSKMAKQHVKVVLSGDGGDEVFCGYSKYFYLHKIFNLNSVLRHSLRLSTQLLSENVVSSLNDRLPFGLKESNFKYKYIKLKNSMKHVDSIQSAFHAASMTNSTAYLQQIFRNMGDAPRNFKHSSDSQNLLFKMMNTDLVNYLPGDILTKVDRATMANGLEAREPLLDHKLIEFSRNISPTLIYKNSSGKYLLKKILEKYIPTNLFDRPKSGFSIPLDSWLKDKFKNEIYDLVQSQHFKTNPLFNHKRINIELDNYFKGSSNTMNFVWYLYVYLRWSRSV